MPRDCGISPGSVLFAKVEPTLRTKMHLYLNNFTFGPLLPQLVGFLIFMNMIDTTSEHLIARKVFFKHFRFCELLKFHAQLS